MAEVTFQFEKADAIVGWMKLRDLWLLSNLAANVPAAGSIIEIGSWAGRSTRAMLDAMPTSATMTAIDHFEVNFDMTALTSKNTFAVEQLTADVIAEVRKTNSIRALFERNLSDSVNYSKLNVFHGHADSFNQLYPNAKADLIFIDGDHTEAGFTADINRAFAQIKPDGIIAGHDFTILHPAIFNVLDNRKRYHSRVLCTLPRSDIFLLIPMTMGGYLTNLLNEYLRVNTALVKRQL